MLNLERVKEKYEHVSDVTSRPDVSNDHASFKHIIVVIRISDDDGEFLVATKSGSDGNSGTIDVLVIEFDRNSGSSVDIDDGDIRNVVTGMGSDVGKETGTDSLGLLC